jgi:hypothetical protein
VSIESDGIIVSVSYRRIFQNVSVINGLEQVPLFVSFLFVLRLSIRYRSHPEEYFSKCILSTSLEGSQAQSRSVVLANVSNVFREEWINMWLLPQGAHSRTSTQQRH